MNYTILLTILSMGCQLLFANQPLQFVSIVAVNNGCSNPNTGNITATISGGVAPYTYSICSLFDVDDCRPVPNVPASPPVNATHWTFENINYTLSANSYIVTVQDSAGHSISPFDFTSIPPFVPVTFTATSVNPLCSGQNGQIIIMAQGGSGLYSYSINGGPFSSPQPSPITALIPAGTSIVAVEDSTGCAAGSTQTITIVSPTPVTFTTSFTSPLCHNGNGSIRIAAQGGTGLYTYSLNGGPASPLLPNPLTLSVPAGTYAIALHDSNACTGGPAQTVTLTNPSQVTFTATSKNGCNGLPTGSITVSAASGGAALVTKQVLMVSQR